MNEEEFIKQLQEKADKTPIPDRLSPEHISEVLSQTPTTKKWYKQPWYHMAAAFLLLGIISTSIWTVSYIRSKQALTNNASDGYGLDAEYAIEESETKSDMQDTASIHPGQNTLKKHNIQTASDYQQLYEILSELTDMFLTCGIGATDDMVFDAAEEAESATGAVNAGAANVEQINTNDENRSYYDTNSQVEYVAEADIVKTDGTYIYSCYGQSDYRHDAIAIAKAENGSLDAVSVISQEAILEEISDYSNETKTSFMEQGTFIIEELYIVNQKLIILCEASSTANNQLNTYILTYDVRNPESPKCLSTLMQAGIYSNSRFTNGCLYTFSEKWTYTPDDYQKYEDYVPYVDDALLTCGNIYLPECPDSSCFQIMTGMKLEESDHFISSKAILSGYGTYYVSRDNIYFAQRDWENGTTKTELLKFSYEDGMIEPEGSVTIPGYLLNQFSMDEYDGYLRVAATVTPSFDKNDSVSVQTNALYIINSNMELVGTIDNLAPEERIYSVRFMGDTGYFVTYRETDPLFSVDLSDPSNPKVMDALKIPGFSNYLHFYSEDLLLGFGEEINPITGEFMGLKLSMFDISDPYNITEVNKTVLPEAYFSPAQYNHKALMIDPERNLIGFYVECYDNINYDYQEDYVIYSYTSNGFERQFTCHLLEEDTFCDGMAFNNIIMDFMRGLYIDEYLYLINGNRICSYSLDTYQKIDRIQIRGKAGN